MPHPGERKVYRLKLNSQTPAATICDNCPMPIYVYQASTKEHCALCETPFERRQKLDHPRIQNCPECRAPIRRVISAPGLARPAPNMSEGNIEKHGFTQYRKSGKGVYEKTAGKGPDVITDKDD
jgi:putative FmdB family regulatory protein